MQAYPTNLPPGGSGTIQIDLMNTGAKQSSGPITVTDIAAGRADRAAAGGMVKAVGLPGPGSSRMQKKKKKFGGVRWNCEGNRARKDGHVHEQPGVPEAAADCKGKSFRASNGSRIEVNVGKGVDRGSIPNRVRVAGGGAAGVTEASNRR